MLSGTCEYLLEKQFCQNNNFYTPLIILSSSLCLLVFLRYMCSNTPSQKKPLEERVEPILPVDYQDYKNLKEKCPVIFVILGHPGSGKGTFAQALSDQKMNHISLGDFLRNEYQHKTDIGLRWKREVEEKGILSVDVVQEVTRTLIESISTSPAQTCILDGHVRLLKQAKELDELLVKYKNITSIFVYINATRENCLERIPNRRTCSKCFTIYNLLTFPPKNESKCDNCDGTLSRRETDNTIQGKNRIDTYASHLSEVLEYYREKGVLFEFNGNLPIQTCMQQYRNAFV